MRKLLTLFFYKFFSFNTILGGRHIQGLEDKYTMWNLLGEWKCKYSREVLWKFWQAEGSFLILIVINLKVNISMIMYIIFQSAFICLEKNHWVERYLVTARIGPFPVVYYGGREEQRNWNELLQLWDTKSKWDNEGREYVWSCGINI